MNEFIVGILTSLIGSVLIIFFSTIVFKNARRLLLGLLSRLLEVDIDYVYKNKEQSLKRVKIELENAIWVKIFTGRGNELQREAFQSIFNKKIINKASKVQILLPNISVYEKCFDYLNQREKELSEFDSNFGDILLQTQVQTIYSYLDKFISKGVIEVKKFNVPCIGRIVITDRCLIYTPYQVGKYSRDCKVYIFRRNDTLYDNLNRFFDQVWDSSEKLNSIA